MLIWSVQVNSLKIPILILNFLIILFIEISNRYSVRNLANNR